MTIYNYLKANDIQNDKYPANPHLVIESATYGIYFVDSANINVLLKTTDEGITVSEVFVYGDEEVITALWYDQPNELLYVLIDTGGGEVDYFDLADSDTKTNVGDLVWAVAGTPFDVFPYDSKDWEVYIEFKVDNNGYIGLKDFTSPAAFDNNMGVYTNRPSTVQVTPIILIGDQVWFLFQWGNENAELWKYDIGDDTWTQLEDCGAGTEIPPKKQRAISYDESDVLYFVLGTGLSEISTIVADIANNITTGEYITLSGIYLDDNGKRQIQDYYIWFNKDAGGGDPTPGGSGIEVAITTGETAQQVSDAIVTAIQASTTQLGIVTNGGGTSTTVTITHFFNGNVDPITDIDSGLSVATTQAGTDNTYYLYTYGITNDVLTKGAEYNIALMLDRNTNTSNDPPFNLEKAFGVETGVNDLMVYQISSKRGNLYKIADLINIAVLSGYTIVAITDTYLFVENSGQVELWKFQDIGDFILDSEFTWAERYFPAGEITYNSLGYYLEQDMFVQVIKEVASGGSTTTAVAFEGYVRKVEDFDESSTQIKIATLVSPAFDDLINYSPEGEFDGRSDQHIVSMLEGADYITEGTLSNGRALSTVKYKGEKFLKAYLDEFGAGDSFTWRLRATGELDYNNNTTDSGVDYSNASTPPAFNIKVSNRDIRYNKIIVKGAIVNGIQLVSTPAENTDEQLIHGVIATEITIAFINTQALVDAWAVALLGLLGSTQTYVEFSVLDTTDEVVAPGETITYADANKGVGSAQFKVNQVTFKGKSTRITTYVISSALRYKIADFEATLPLQNSQLIAQNTELIANIAGDLTLFLHEEASSDIAGYLQLLQGTPDDAKNTITDTITTADQEVEQWATEPGIPGVVVLDEFISVIHVHAWKSAGIKNIQIYFKLYSRATGGAETLVATSETSANIPSTEVHQVIHMSIPEVAIDATDRLVLKLFANPIGNGSNPELSFAIEGDTLARIELQVPALIPSDLNAHITNTDIHTKYVGLDPAAFDYDKAALAAIHDVVNEWADIDFTALTDANTFKIEFIISVQDATEGIEFYLRKNGQTNEINRAAIIIQKANIYNSATLVVECDSSQIVEFKTITQKVSNWDNIFLAVRGYWTTD